MGPSGAIILAEHGGEMAAALPALYISLLHDIIQVDALLEIQMVDHQQPPGF